MNAPAETRKSGSRSKRSGTEGPLYERVADRLQGLVERGTLRPGERLPSVRRLHRQWSVSVSTVLEAYRLLEDRGVLEVRPQSGHYVRARPNRMPEPRPEARPLRPREIDQSDLMVRVTMRAGAAGLVRMGCGLPDRSLLPIDALNRTIARVARNNTDSHDYTVSPGHPRLRRVLAARMIDAGCTLHADDLVITNGCQEALDLCLRAVARPGDAVIVESPTYFGLLEVMKSQGLRAIEVPGRPRAGVDVDTVAAALAPEGERIAAVVLSANYTNPLGALVSDEDKARLVALCRQRGVPLIEDDAYGELGFDGQGSSGGKGRPRSLKAWDEDGTVLSCGTLSKTLSPGLRVGWVAAGRYHSAVSRMKMVSTLGSPTVPQLAAAEFLRDGGYDRHLRRMRRVYRDRVRRMSEAVHAAFPEGTRLSRPLGGQFLWIEMPEPADAMDVFEAAWDAGIAVAPGSMFSPSGGYRRSLRLNCSVPWSDAVVQAVHTLGTLVASRV